MRFKKMELSIALNRYDRHVPFFNQTVTPPKGFTLKPFEVGESLPFKDGADRHDRILHDLEYDIGEMGLSGWIMAVERDPDLPLIGLPIFPRRFFSFGQIYINPNSGIDTPSDLKGKKIGLHAWQTTLSVLAKGDLHREYGFDWRGSEWISMREEPIPVNFSDDMNISIMSEGKDMGVMLMEGEIDALMSPQPRRSMLAEPNRYKRLFAADGSSEVAYFRKYGFYPIMHLMVMRRELAERFPELPKQVMQMCDEAYRLAQSYYDDSNYSLLVWARNALEHQKQMLGTDPWANGFQANKKNLEQFIQYSHDQRLISHAYGPEKLFHHSLLNT
jgi:4,5-dihydroxyphthalate decarboxylase